jgi:hypothetical protein
VLSASLMLSLVGVLAWIGLRWFGSGYRLKS